MECCKPTGASGMASGNPTGASGMAFGNPTGAQVTAQTRPKWSYKGTRGNTGSQDSLTVTDVAHLMTNHGTITIGLCRRVVPKTCENFKQMVMGTADGSGYTGTTFHKVLKGFAIIGGDVDASKGVSRRNIYNSDGFADENFTLKHSAPGCVTMYNNGRHTNGTTFMITTAPAPWLDGRHVVFGRVLEGLEIVRSIAGLERPEILEPSMNSHGAMFRAGIPSREVIIHDCYMEPNFTPISISADTSPS